jgi:tRNA (uracil-5-)-methyltransferase
MPLSQFDTNNYIHLLEQKERRIVSQFSGLGVTDLEVFDSPASHFRMRAEFRLWHEDDDIFYAMFEKGAPTTPIRIDHFPIASQAICSLMPRLLKALKNNKELKNRLFQVEFLASTNDDVLVSLIYHRALSEQWSTEAKALESALNIKIIGRSRKQKLVLSDDFVTETLHVNGRDYQYQQVENSFTQPNAAVNEKMLSWAEKHASQLDGDLLELYCGNGNFTAVLAQHFKQVLATEISKTSVRSARYNFEQNNITNVSIARMSSEELTQAFNKVREFRRMKSIDLDSYHISTVFVDPPRAGLDPGTEALVSRFDHIIYVSCNPDTLHENLTNMAKTHEIRHFAIFDQFPYTDHIECGAVLCRR